MIHASDFKPRVYPFKGTSAFTQIDRLQDMSASVTLNRTKIEEIGRDGLVDWRKSIPSLTLTLRQLEYGEMEFWRQLSNSALNDTKVEWTDFATSQVDIAGYETTEDSTFKSTVWYPNLRVSGFSLAIGDPEALIERTFNLVGEDEITLQGDNKYLIVLNDTTSSGAGHTIQFNTGTYVNYPIPIADPDESGSAAYILKIVKVTSAGIATELVLTTDYTYDGSDTITIPGSANGDTFKVYYSAGTYIVGENPFTNNDIDAAGFLATQATIILKTSDQVYRLQSVGVDITMDRFDVREIGNNKVVSRGTRDITCRVTLGRILDEWTVEEVLRGVAPDYGKIDIRKFEDEIALLIKVYTDDNKGTFSIGYKFTDLAPVGLEAGTPVNDYVTRGVTLEGEGGFVTSNEGEM